MTDNSEREAILANHPGLSALHRAKGLGHDKRQTPLSKAQETQLQVQVPPQDTLATGTSVMNVVDTGSFASAPQVTTPTKPTASEEHDWEKRYGDSRRYASELQDKIKELENQVKAATQEKVILPKTADELAAWKTQYPELHDSVLTMIRQEGLVLTEELDKAKGELNKIQSQTRRESLFNEVLGYHKDADEIRRSQGFKEWFGKQSQGIKNLIESSESTDIIRGITLYKSDVATPTTTTYNPKSAEAAGAVMTSRSTSTPTVPTEWTEESIRSMSAKDYARNRDAILTYRRAKK